MLKDSWKGKWFAALDGERTLKWDLKDKKGIKWKSILDRENCQSKALKMG
jgi:hypothetical protein